MSPRWPTATLMLLALVGTPAVGGGTGIEATRHNLSVSGPGPIRAVDEDRICVFCHISHVEGAADAPLWNHQSNPVLSYKPYESSTMVSRTAQPDGASRLCLSCHDGTIAVGAIRGQDNPIDLQGTGAAGRLSATHSANVGTDLSGSHPISIPYRSATSRVRNNGGATWLRETPSGTLTHPALDSNDKVQCTTCHDPHSDPAADGANVPPFWRGPNFSVVCEQCHVAPMADEGHDNPITLPADCGSCHVGHGVGEQPLLPESEEEACYDCHGGPERVRATREAGRLGIGVVPTRIDDLFDRPYTHPVERTSGAHETSEALRTEGVGARRHAECSDCHNIHGQPDAEARTQKLLAKRGADRGGDSDEHLDCYECHSDNANLPFGSTDKSDEFDPANASYHPVEAPTTGGRDASLRSPWLPGDQVRCTDCHGADSDDERRGPHGSRNQWLLTDRYIAMDGADESEGAYAACYSCHSRSAVIGGRGWRGHTVHVVQEKSSCYACHDSHGSPDYPGLIRFNKDLRTSQVMPSTSGKLEYMPNLPGTTDGGCFLSCHGVDHNPLVYP